MKNKVIKNFIKKQVYYKKSLLNLKLVSDSIVILDNFSLLFLELLDRAAIVFI